jgi:formylglycine-generating enzyme required for sulfatase activity/predicted Ser/Thr protein kinase
MSAFLTALRTFRSGQLTHDELLSEIYRQLTVEKTPSATLLEILEIQQSAEPLPDNAYEGILNRIANWPLDPTIVTGAIREQRADRVPIPGVGDMLQGRFTLVELIGEGGMSLVFKAIDLRRIEAGAPDPHVAIKVLTEPFNEYFGSLTALQREAHKLQSLTHPNIVRVIDCDRDGQTVFMTMEYLAGESLQKKLRPRGASRMDPSVGEAIVTAVANALEYAHRNDIVHGDLKPGNIIITEKGEVKVIDFGMARFITRAEATPQNPEVPREKSPKAVTPRYASPEMMAGHDPEPADDVYALACIAYEVLSGAHPFGRQKDPGARDPHLCPPRPSGMSVHRYAALVKALAFDRQVRTSTVRQFLDEYLTVERGPRIKRWAWMALAVLVAATALYGLVFSRLIPGAAPPRPESSASGAVIRDCPTCPLMTVLPAGRFNQGAPKADANALPFEQPQHAVTIGQGLAMGSNEVTVAEFREFVEATRREMSGCNTYDGRWQYRADANWQSPGFAQNPMHPVTCVSWDDAAAYANWLSQKSAHRYRLASASEWEYAARAGGDSPQPWGLNGADACVNANVADESAALRFPGWQVFPCSDGYVGTAPVGSFKANAFGLNDLLGNVFEWVADCWHEDYGGAPADGAPRLDGDCSEHELRGGSWFSAPRYVSASYRNRFATDYRSSSIGFRVVRESGK